MKKSFLLLIAVALFFLLGLVSCKGSKLCSNNRELSELELANIEALTDDKSGDFTCRWAHASDASGRVCYVCIKTGTGDLCKCGDVKYD